MEKTELEKIVKSSKWYHKFFIQDVETSGLYDWRPYFDSFKTKHIEFKNKSLIDVAGDEIKKHIESKKCNSNLVFLEEDLINEKIPKIKNFEQTVPTDRILWVCSHCRPPQKFTDRSAYIAHHYTHS